MLIFATERYKRRAGPIPGNDKKNKKMKTKYYIAPVTDSKDFVLYYQLVRRADEAILYSNESLDNIMLHCWHNSISAADIVLC